jgi:hypothetical protein
MDEYYELLNNNKIYQKKLHAITDKYNELNQKEDILQKKIVNNYEELNELKKEFNSVMDTYIHIIKSSIAES